MSLAPQAVQSCHVQSEGVKNESKGLQETGLPASPTGCSIPVGLSDLTGAVLGLPDCISPCISSSRRRIGGIWWLDPELVGGQST